MEAAAGLPSAARTPLFARDDFRRVAGETLRPGGLALTLRALELAGLAPGSLAADVGCGPGATARLLAGRGHRVIALDPDEPGLAGACGPDVLALCARAERLPVATGTLDAVFCECVLSVTENPAAVLAEAARALRPGGALAISDLYRRGQAPECSPPGCAPIAFGCASGALDPAQLRAGLAGAGLTLAVFEDHSRLLAELAGRLIFAGLDPAELGGGCAAGARPGYFLCLARKNADCASADCASSE